ELAQLFVAARDVEQQVRVGVDRVRLDELLDRASIVARGIQRGAFFVELRDARRVRRRGARSGVGSGGGRRQREGQARRGNERQAGGGKRLHSNVLLSRRLSRADEPGGLVQQPGARRRLDERGRRLGGHELQRGRRGRGRRVVSTRLR